MYPILPPYIIIVAVLIVTSSSAACTLDGTTGEGRGERVEREREIESMYVFLPRFLQESFYVFHT